MQIPKFKVRSAKLALAVIALSLLAGICVWGQFNNLVAPSGTLTLKTNVLVTGGLTVGTSNLVGIIAGKQALDSTLTSLSARTITGTGDVVLATSPTFITPNLGVATATSLTATKAFQAYQGSLTHAGTVTLDFDTTTTVNAITLTGAVTFATSNLATNRTYRLKITGTSTNAVPTFPAWKFLGGAPSVITASKVSMLSLEAWGSADANVVAAWAEEQ
jgi:hypothetical protein